MFKKIKVIITSILSSNQLNQELRDAIYFNEVKEFNAIVKQRDVLWLDNQLEIFNQSGENLVHIAVDNLPNIPEREISATHYVAMRLFQISSRYVEFTDKEGRTPLHQLAMKGNIIGIRFLLNCGANVSARDKSENTPLYYAVLNCHLSATEVLLHANSIVRNHKEDDETFPLKDLEEETPATAATAGSLGSLAGRTGFQSGHSPMTDLAESLSSAFEIRKILKEQYAGENGIQIQQVPNKKRKAKEIEVQVTEQGSFPTGIGPDHRRFQINSLPLDDDEDSKMDVSFAGAKRRKISSSATHTTNSSFAPSQDKDDDDSFERDHRTSEVGAKVLGANGDLPESPVNARQDIPSPQTNSNHSSSEEVPSPLQEMNENSMKEQLPPRVQMIANKYDPSIRFTAADLRAARVSNDFLSIIFMSWDNIKFSNIKWVVNPNIDQNIAWPHAWVRQASSLEIDLCLKPLPQKIVKKLCNNWKNYCLPGKKHREYLARAILGKSDFIEEDSNSSNLQKQTAEVGAKVLGANGDLPAASPVNARQGIPSPQTSKNNSLT